MSTGTVAASLQLEPAMRFENGAEQRGKRERLAKEARDLRRVIIMGKHRVDRGAEAHEAPAQIERLDGEGQ